MSAGSMLYSVYSLFSFGSTQSWWFIIYTQSTSFSLFLYYFILLCVCWASISLNIYAHFHIIIIHSHSWMLNCLLQLCAWNWTIHRLNTIWCCVHTRHTVQVTHRILLQWQCNYTCSWATAMLHASRYIGDQTMECLCCDCCAIN